MCDDTAFVPVIYFHFNSASVTIQPADYVFFSLDYLRLIAFTVAYSSKTCQCRFVRRLPWPFLQWFSHDLIWWCS